MNENLQSYERNPTRGPRLGFIIHKFPVIGCEELHRGNDEIDADLLNARSVKKHFAGSVPPFILFRHDVIQIILTSEDIQRIVFMRRLVD